MGVMFGGSVFSGLGVLGSALSVPSRSGGLAWDAVSSLDFDKLRCGMLVWSGLSPFGFGGLKEAGIEG